MSSRSSYFPCPIGFITNEMGIKRIGLDDSDTVNISFNEISQLIKSYIKKYSK